MPLTRRHFRSGHQVFSVRPNHALLQHDVAVRPALIHASAAVVHVSQCKRAASFRDGAFVLHDRKRLLGALVEGVAIKGLDGDAILRAQQQQRQQSSKRRRRLKLRSSMPTSSRRRRKVTSAPPLAPAVSKTSRWAARAATDIQGKVDTPRASRSRPSEPRAPPSLAAAARGPAPAPVNALARMNIHVAQCRISCAGCFNRSAPCRERGSQRRSQEA